MWPRIDPLRIRGARVHVGLKPRARRPQPLNSSLIVRVRSIIDAISEFDGKLNVFDGVY